MKDLVKELKSYIAMYEAETINDRQLILFIDSIGASMWRLFFKMKL